MTGTLHPLLHSVVDGGTPGRSCIRVLMDPILLCPVTPHRYLNSYRGVISEPDLLCSSETEILEGLSDQGVIRVRRITLKKDSSLFPTKHLILTFNSPKLPSTIKAGYLNFKPPTPKIPISNDVPSATIPSTSAILPTIQSETLLPIPIPTTTTSTSNNLNTSASSLSTEILPVFTTANKFAALLTEVQPSVSLSGPTSNNENFNTSQIPNRLKQNSKNRKRRVIEQKAEIEIKLTPHTPKKSYVHHTSEDENMIMYDVDRG
ncbi:uncharacterized protein TNCV_131721 [Trichonephila clavipes]|nr:uncharacterized protein TNCV_131721 [Trichonephila clavipes]